MKKLIGLLLVAAFAAFAQTAQYPGALADDEALVVAVDRSSTALNGGIDGSTLTVVVDDGTEFLAHQIVTVEAEQMQICSIATNTLTLCSGSRGFNGTAPATHGDGVTISGYYVSWHHNALREEIIAIETALGVNLSSVAQEIASGTAALGTSLIATTACATVVTVSATGTATTDVISWTPNADIVAVTGYAPSTSGGLAIYPYPTANNVNFKVCNPTASSITPGAVTLNWRVDR